ncbi:MAG: chromosome segregation protein SMC [Lachnospiraceae bacterium]|nr:chromosome segregation protein SMC [Lachnospiraceae bacterium]
MYLKRIEVQGFKSFANKIRFDFHNGITAIVGPNGSGKSNVADAVRWVLGEQRIKQLRGSSMQDVIFSGTELRKPQSYASVSITFDNSDHSLETDYNEVTVTRRLYRSGESDYMLNGTSCRLKDINELFYDTGIGKEGYSIIGQGQIDRILSEKPEDRRELFDEAAGIVKFKRRKEAALKKLENEKSNLVRIEDILSELGKQIGPLEKQAQKARIYLDARQEQKVLDVNIFLQENQRSRDLLAELSGKLDTAAEQLERASEALLTVKQDSDKARLASADLEKEIEDTRAVITNSDVVRGRLEADIKVYQEQIRSARSNAEHFARRKETLTALISEREEEIFALRTNKESIDSKLRELTAKKEAAENVLRETTDRITAVSDGLDDAREQLMNLLNERAMIRSRQASLETLETQVKSRKAELTSQLLSIASNESRQDELIVELENRFDAITKELGELKQKESGTDEAIQGMKSKLAMADENLQKATQLYHQQNSRLQALKNMTERYEGFGSSVRRVMEHKESSPGIIGVVADLIRTKSEYETAIEVALGGSIQNIVTTDEKTAEDMIRILKNEKAGRATFLPLTAIRDTVPFNYENALSEPGVIGLADSLVTTEPEYADVAKNLLGRILIVDRFANAVDISRKYHSRIRMVTLEGELFSPGGAISGGAYRQGGNLLSRRREIADLEEKTAAAKEDVKRFEQLIEDTKRERTELRAELEQIRILIQTRTLEQNTARLNVVREKEKKTEFTGSLDRLKEENSAIEERLSGIAADKESARRSMEESLERETVLNETIDSREKELLLLRGDESEKTAEAASWDVDIEKLYQQQRFEETNVQRAEEEAERLKAELAEILEGIETSEKEIGEKSNNIQEIEQTIASSHTVQEDHEIKLKDALERRNALREKLSTLMQSQESLTEEKSVLDRECVRLSAQKEKAQDAFESSIQYMWDEYEITLSDAEKMRSEETEDLGSMKKRLSAIKQKIKELGSVNVDSIEEYRDVKERFTFLNDQHDDLVRSEAALREVIRDLDQSMRQQFGREFEKIAAEFDKVFKVLFGGGAGRLELVEDEDILEAGVRVIAQPPGKKLQNMMMLSGGEKSLTAIALLFAIQNLKPSPFCLLDEIEAALDENNVVRFALYLQKLTKNTQFIVITHRRGTMERADRLYGITMQEKGVSTLVSVNLIDSELN